MSNSTSNLNLIQSGQAQKEVTANALFDAASPSMLFGRNSVTTAGLSWGYYGGAFRKSDGTFVQLTNDVILLNDDATNYVEADKTNGSVSVNTTDFTAGAIPLYQIDVSAGFVIEYYDYRVGTQGDGTLY